ncbi:MAG: hypothetical protein KDA05_09965 [Phycisphaerales bacterium]|nr:hypothetical protein [Phycisphaerales bacterium]
MIARFAAFCLVWLVWAAPALGVQPTDEGRVLAFDPVLLCQGREVEGDPALSLTRGPFEYRFRDEASRDAFAADPDRYEIQFNGACARMGPLSSGGDARRFAVHDGRVYVFASESCRRTFIEHADAMLEKDERPLLPAGCEADQGRELVDRAIEWVGGRAALADCRSYLETMHAIAESGGATYEHDLLLSIEFADDASVARAIRTDDWGQYGLFGHAIADDDAMRLDRDGTDGPVTRSDLVAAQRRAFERAIDRSLIVVLKAAARDDANLCRVGTGTIDDAAIEEVAIHIRGITATLSIEPESGRIVAIEHIARGGPHLMLGARQTRFTRYQTVAGLRLPVAGTVLFDGEPEPDEDFDDRHVAINLTTETALPAADGTGADGR